MATKENNNKKIYTTMETTIKTTEIVKGITVNVPKQAKNLAKYVSDDDLRPAMKCVCLDASNGLMCATDAKRLQALRVDVQGVPEGVKILFDPKHITKVAGKEVTVTVTEEERESVNDKGERQKRTVFVTEMVCGGEKYRTENRFANFPNFMCVLPKGGLYGKGRACIHLTGESVEALKDICKIHRREVYGIALAVKEGSKVLTVCKHLRGGNGEFKAAYTLELSEAAPVSVLVGFDAKYLSVCLDGCDGVLSSEKQEKESVTRSVLFGGVDGYTLLMPCVLNYETETFINEARAESVSGSLWSEDVDAVRARLQQEASELWKEIKDYNNDFEIGNYSAMEIAKQKCGYFNIPNYGKYEAPLYVTAGNVRIIVEWSVLFTTLAAWEATGKGKSVFSVGNAVSEVETAPVQEQEGEIRVKCLQYAANGNDVCEKYENLKKYTDGVYYKDVQESNGYVNRCIYFEENGIFWHETNAPDYFFEKPEARENVEDLRNGWVKGVKAGAERGEYINKLTIEVFRRLGLETSSLMEARAKAIKRQEDEERRKREDQERKRLEDLEAEKKRKAEALEDGCKKLMAFEPITAEQVELLAENIGMKINIRTLGFIRKNVRTATHNENSSVSVSGNVKGRSISGVCNVIWSLYKAYKEETEENITEPKAKNIIKSFEDVNSIIGNGQNICVGCEFEHAGSCYEHCTGDDFAACNRQAERHGVKRVPVNKYHIVTYSHDSGCDDKEDAATLGVAEELAKKYVSDSYYYMVRIFYNSHIVREYENGKCVKIRVREWLEAEAKAQQEADKEANFEAAFIHQAMEHKKAYGYRFGNYILYRRNEMFYAFGKEAEILREWFDGKELKRLSDHERELNGEKFIAFKYYEYNGAFEGNIKNFFEQKHVAEFGKPSNGLITIFDAEEVEYWHKAQENKSEEIAEETPRQEMNEETKAYFRNVYGTHENLKQEGDKALARLRKELQEYTENTRKGGRERKGRMRLITQSIRNIEKEMIESKQAFI